MPTIKLLTERDLREAVQLDTDIVDCIDAAFATLAGGKVVMPPILSMGIHEYNGEVDVKTAYVPGTDSFAIKISPGFFDNPKIGLPTTSGLMILFSARTGTLEALLLDNGYLTDVRTAAAGAVAARHLARGDAATAAILGAGMQAKLQLEALSLVRPITSARIWARDADKAEAAASELTGKLGLPVTASASVTDAITGADSIVTATPANEPLILPGMLEPGQHVTAMGSDQEHKNEIAAEVIGSCDLYVPDRHSQTKKLGELHHAIEQNAVSASAMFPELGDVIAGKHPGRTSRDQITIADLTGTGLQDTAIATLAHQRCTAACAGMAFES
ncbi:MAG: ectoine utilization protein EutC [Hyphomicrobiales bacterium]|nr:ectoine utilization protein EutC [Hyphomicrobiales bacterium]